LFGSQTYYNLNKEIKRKFPTLRIRLKISHLIGRCQSKKDIYHWIRKPRKRDRTKRLLGVRTSPWGPEDSLSNPAGRT
jgi:hypothetical protein